MNEDLNIYVSIEGQDKHLIIDGHFALLKEFIELLTVMPVSCILDPSLESSVEDEGEGPVS